MSNTVTFKRGTTYSGTVTYTPAAGGPANLLTTTGAPGSFASVTNSGTTSAAVFDFAIPRGDVGATGATGATGPAGPGVAAGGTTGQILSKASGTSYDTTWSTIIPGDRYLTTSTTSLTINNVTKTLTVGTGLSYTPTQNVTIAYDASNHMHGEVLTYNSGTGVMTVDVNHHTGSGTYAVWTVNVGGVTPATSTTWGSITGTLSAQVDLQGSLDAKLAKASNLSDLVSAPTARTNLGLGTAAVEPATKLVPSGGTTGQVLSKVSATSWDLQWATASGGGGGINVQSFGTASTSGTFTWTKPAGAKQVEVFMWGGGGGGGAGSCNATTIARAGGGAGAGSTFFYTITDAAYLGATETITVGAGGAGAAGTTGTSGGTGTVGGNSIFHVWRAVGGNFGLGGSNVGGGGGQGRLSTFFLSNNTNTLGTGAQGTTSSGVTGGSNTSMNYAASGGGGGCGALANITTQQTGGAGGPFSAALNNAGMNVIISGGAGGNPVGPVQPTAGVSSATISYNAGTGGGGGFYRTATAGSSGAGGGWPGGGGGGGGACDTGFTSGGGGSGANGRVVIVTYL